MTMGSTEKLQQWIKIKAYAKIFSRTGPHMKQAKLSFETETHF
jgi:hypothetical protein